MSLSYLEIQYMCGNKIYTWEILIVESNNFKLVSSNDKIEYLICEDYNTVSLYMIGWFISTNRVNDSRLKNLYIENILN